MAAKKDDAPSIATAEDHSAKDSPTGSTGQPEARANFLPTSVPTVRCGNRTLALEISLKNGHVRAVAREVVPVADGLRVVGWKSVFRGIYLTGTPEELAAFGQELHARLTKRSQTVFDDKPPVKRPLDYPGPFKLD